MALKTGPVIDNQYKAYIESMYSPIQRDQIEKNIDGIMSLVEMAGDRRQSLEAVLEQACKIIFRLFGFREITIGLKSREDFQYRYVSLFGQRKDVADKMRKIKYSYEDMFSQDKFPFIKIGKISQFNPVEGLPEWEKDLFHRAFQLGEKRTSQDEFHEGDYIDTWIYGNNNDLIGWIELTSPADGKIPPRTTLKWIELIAGILGHIITEKWLEADAPRK